MLIQEKKMLSTPCSRVCGDRRGSHSATPAPARQAVPIRSAGRNAELECGRSADDLSPGGLAGAQGQGQDVSLMCRPLIGRTFRHWGRTDGRDLAFAARVAGQKNKAHQRREDPVFTLRR